MNNYFIDEDQRSHWNSIGEEIRSSKRVGGSLITPKLDIQGAAAYPPDEHKKAECITG
jgi:hypothetical protein